MKLKLNFLKNNYILIWIFKENLEWFNFFKDRKNCNQYFPTVGRKSLFDYKHVKKSLFNYIYKSNTEYDQILETEWRKIKSSTEYLKSKNFKLPYELPNKFNYDQALLNTIHRFFTYNSAWALLGCNNDMSGNTPIDYVDVPNPFDPSFIPTDLRTFFTAINNLNVSVHELEMFCTTTNKDMILNTIKENKKIVVDVRNSHEYTNNGWIYFGNTLDEFQKSYSNTYPNVILTEEIQGKSYLRAFADNDDPTQSDVTGRYGSYGGFLIDIYQHRKQIYESKEFNDWLETYGLKKENLPLEHPLGQIIESSLLLTDFDADNFTGIDFIDD
jgi:hypothetical protein